MTGDATWDLDETCVFDDPECGDVVMWDASGEPWCQRCVDRFRAEEVAAGRNDPERPVQ